jgi:hypothetical protein
MQKARRLFARVGVAIAAALMMVGMSACSTVATAPPGQVVQTAPVSASAAAPAQAPAAAAASAKVQALAQTIDRQCRIGLPFMQSLLVLQTDPGAVALVTKAQADATKVCTVAATLANPPFGASTLPTLDLSAINAFAASRVPDLLTLVKNSSLSDAQKTAAMLSITGAQVVLLQATAGR